MSRNPNDRLKEYRGKRNFARTSEPEPASSAPSGSRFVVQKHDARRLHYDLRLELDGALLSWAVPQGPSFVTMQKRLAVRTEDHPLKYLEFEGVIPKGEYGGGAMIVWDRGAWRPVHDPHKSIAKGHLEFELDGERLKGRWHLVRMRPRVRVSKEQWLLIKAADKYQRSESDQDMFEKEDTSVLSGRTTDDLERENALREDHRKRTAIVAARQRKLPDIAAIRGARKALLPLFVEPCLASTADNPPAGDKWRHEVKFDGYRIQARIDADETRLLTRTGLNWTNRFSVIAEAVKKLGLGSAVLDGEIVVEDAAGISSFAELVGDLKSGRQDRFRYYVFDLLYLNGADLRTASLDDRKRALAGVLASAPDVERIRLSEHFEIDGAKFFEHVSRLGLEGMVSKRPDAPYRSGRSKDWLKSRCVLSQEFVVIGYTPSTASRRSVGALVLGYYERDRLTHAGRVGSGFTQDDAATLFEGLEQIKIPKLPLDPAPPKEAQKDVRWVEPRLVVQVDYHAWANDGLIRHATYRGLREDKDPREIRRENRGGDPVRPKFAPAAALTHPDRMLWPSEGITKQGLADFYLANAGRILPHLTDRPLSLVRCPGGVDAECFYAKRAWHGLDAAVRRIDTGKREQSLLIENADGLLALVQGNVLEIHPWGALAADLERPDRLIFDLDPGDGVSWSAVNAAAREVRERLKTSLKLESFVKTSGGKGLHVVAPLVPSMTWEPAKQACKDLAEAMEADNPRRYVANMAKRLREGKIFVDYLRNGRGATAVAPYSTRARAGAAVSTPLGWDELSDAVKADHYRLGNIERRLAYLKRDPWEGFFELDQRLEAGAGDSSARTRRPSTRRLRT
jgi:bifunctional non-homologous end joining protein LigD